MQNDMGYFSMMGLLKEADLKGVYHQGAWHKFRSLGDVIEKMDKYETGNEDKHSIPDVYGRPLQLKITMESMRDKSEKEKSYLLTKEIVAWRGILTAIALQDFLELKLKVDVVNYGDEGNAFDTALKYPPKSNVFSAAGSWDNRIFHIVTIQGDEGQSVSDIAMFSPMTVVYPIADLEMPKVEKLKWYDYEKREFKNPAKSLSATEKLTVCFWIQCLTELLKQNGDAQEADVVRYHLEAYEKELRSGLDGKELVHKNCFDLVEYDTGFANINGNTVINKALNHTVRVRVCLDGQHWIEYKELFADQLYYTEREDNPFIGCSYISGHEVEDANHWYALIPLSKTVQEQCDREALDNLMRNFRMKAVGDTPGKVKYVVAQLKLSEITDMNVDAERIYNMGADGDVVQEKSGFPVIALWPRINMPEWGQYYIYVQGGKNGRILPDMKGGRRGDNRYVEAVKSYPGAISLKRIKDKKEYDIGMVFPEYREYGKTQKEKANVNAVVGVDFGTSGTTIYTRICDENVIKPIAIRKKDAKLLTAADESDREYMNKYFVMPEDSGGNEGGEGLEDTGNIRQEKLYSIYLRFDDEPHMDVNPLLDGIIYQAGENEMTEGTKRFMPDIKWENPNNGAYYKAFIEELCLHIWEQLRGDNVTSIEWRYALPISIADSETFHTMWQKDILAFLEKNIVGIGHTVASGNYTESEAASRYFLDSGELKVVNPEKGYMIVDIGGGSTDIAVWQRGNFGNTMIAQTSVPVAGRMLFTHWLGRNMNRIMEHAFSKESEVRKQYIQLKDLNNGSNGKIINAILERIVNHNNQRIMTSYQQGTEWAVILKRQLEFGVALLFFSLGSLVGYLQKKDILKNQGEGNFGIALGGNGSKILDWLKMKSEYPELLIMFREGIRSREMSGYACNPQIIRSRTPKEEVARGLVQDEWEKVPPSAADIKEEISDEIAINWNKAFLNKYNELFHQSITVKEDDIRNLMANMERKTDVCNFFMSYMYGNYYNKKFIGELK